MSVTTLEEVFIRIADEEVSLEAHKRQEALVDGQGLLHDESEGKGRGQGGHATSMLQAALNALPFTDRTAAHARAHAHAHAHVGLQDGGGVSGDGVVSEMELVATADQAHSPNKGGPMTSVVPVASVGLSVGSHLDAQGKPAHADGNHAATAAHGVTHGGAHGPPSAESVVSDASQPQYKSLNIFQQVAVLMRKRLIVFSRDRKGAFFQLIVPVILIGLVLGILMVEVRPSLPPSLVPPTPSLTPLPPSLTPLPPSLPHPALPPSPHSSRPPTGPSRRPPDLQHPRRVDGEGPLPAIVGQRRRELARAGGSHGGTCGRHQEL